MTKSKKEKKIFVLDTSVIIYEHNSILNFDEHDVGIPITVLEELDNFKKGNDTKNFEAREFIRLIDKLLLASWTKGASSLKPLSFLILPKPILNSASFIAMNVMSALSSLCDSYVQTIKSPCSAT